MKKVIFSMLAVATLIFASCGGSKQITADDTADIAKITGKKWQLIELAGKPIAGMINGKMPYLQFHASESRYSATGGCNTMNGGYKFDKGLRLRFTGGISTMMACPDMESDRALAEVFKLTDNYTLHDGVLSLNVGRRAPLAKFKEVANDTELAGTWELSFMADTRLPLITLFPEKKATITFEAGSNKVSGNGGCNNYGGNLEIKGDEVNFSDIFSTKMACPGQGEGLYFQKLASVDKITVSGDTLSMSFKNRNILSFKKK
ncbi:META domain-containing protein [Sphingobacterium kyonggiense]|uniref:META domain-containing protein n=1 Tax=Sphingobacterium kyonggiense TaxID=714075 RepID=A0ABP7Y8Y3_9SPHI